MRVSVMKFVLPLVGLMLSTASGAQWQKADDTDVIKIEIVSGPKIVGTPEIWLEPGRSTVVTAASRDGYVIEVSTRRLSGALGRGIRLKYYAAHRGKWTLLGAPNIETGVGQENALSLKALDGGTLTMKIKVERTLRPMPHAAYYKMKKETKAVV